MKLTIILRDATSIVLENLSAQEAQGLTIAIENAVTDPKPSMTKINYADGSQVLVASDHIQAVKLQS